MDRKLASAVTAPGGRSSTKRGTGAARADEWQARQHQGYRDMTRRDLGARPEVEPQFKPGPRADQPERLPVTQGCVLM